jgi:glycosyltransferase involved in cell wall biosynthesis
MNIIVQESFFLKWRGGQNYLSNTLIALKQAGHQLFKLSEKSGESESNPLYSDSFTFRYPTKASLFRLTYRLHPTKTLRFLNPWVDKMDAGFQLSDENLRKLVPTVHWIADFQHIERPDFFSPEEIAKRTSDFEWGAKTASKVLLSSFHAESVFKKHFPKWAQKSCVAHFSVEIPPSIFKISFDELQSLYRLPKSYIHFPGQWWQHKNHALVLNALQNAPDSLPIVITGNKDDYRHPTHRSQIEHLISNSTWVEKIVDLGEIPYQHMLAIMRFSTGVINPSSYEGWSTTVEEAKIFQKPIILSAIDVHKEQSPEKGMFFDISDVNSLSDHLNSTASLETEISNSETVLEKVQIGMQQFSEDVNKAFTALDSIS